MKTFVISAFPGCGKSTMTNFINEGGAKVIDSDSSLFSWVVNEDGEKERNPEFPENYINHIKENIGKQNVIFVSSHKIVREALRKNRIRTIIVYPPLTVKELYLKNYKDRGNDENFINLINNNWETWINEIKEELKDKNSMYTGVELPKSFPYITSNILASIVEYLTNFGN